MDDDIEQLFDDAVNEVDDERLREQREQQYQDTLELLYDVAKAALDDAYNDKSFDVLYKMLLDREYDNTDKLMNSLKVAAVLTGHRDKNGYIDNPTAFRTSSNNLFTDETFDKINQGLNVFGKDDTTHSTIEIPRSKVNSENNDSATRTYQKLKNMSETFKLCFDFSDDFPNGINVENVVDYRTKINDRFDLISDWDAHYKTISDILRNKFENHTNMLRDQYKKSGDFYDKLLILRDYVDEDSYRYVRDLGEKLPSFATFKYKSSLSKIDTKYLNHTFAKTLSHAAAGNPTNDEIVKLYLDISGEFPDGVNADNLLDYRHKLNKKLSIVARGGDDDIDNNDIDNILKTNIRRNNMAWLNGDGDASQLLDESKIEDYRNVVRDALSRTNREGHLSIEEVDEKYLDNVVSTTTDKVLADADDNYKAFDRLGDNDIKRYRYYFNDGRLIPDSYAKLDTPDDIYKTHQYVNHTKLETNKFNPFYDDFYGMLNADSFDEEYDSKVMYHAVRPESVANALRGEKDAFHVSVADFQDIVGQALDKVISDRQIDGLDGHTSLNDYLDNQMKEVSNGKYTSVDDYGKVLDVNPQFAYSNANKMFSHLDDETVKKYAHGAENGGLVLDRNTELTTPEDVLNVHQYVKENTINVAKYDDFEKEFDKMYPNGDFTHDDLPLLYNYACSEANYQKDKGTENPYDVSLSDFQDTIGAAISDSILDDDRDIDGVKSYDNNYLDSYLDEKMKEVSKGQYISVQDYQDTLKAREMVANGETFDEPVKDAQPKSIAKTKEVEDDLEP